MKSVNEITMAIIGGYKNGDTIHNLAKRIDFAYSAVYKWVNILADYDVLYLVKKGNKTIIKINKNIIYKKFIELNNAVDTIEKDKTFWSIIKKLKLRMRFVRGTAVAIWTKGSYITGDFADRIYFLEIYEKNLNSLKNILEKYKINYSQEKIIKKRPLVFIISRKSLKIERKNGLQVMPLNELVNWCKNLYLENILEQLDELYNLKLKEKYAEVKTNL